MRIISGRFGGRKLKTFKADWIRPTSDVVKGSIFNKLQAQVPGAHVLDLFAGTGNLSFEALSRGAASVTSVEKHPGSIKIIRENAQLLKVEDEIQILRADVFEDIASRNLSQIDLIFIDPPFTEKWADKVMQSLAKNDTQNPGLIVVIESSRHEDIFESYGPLERWDQKDFGDKRVSYFRRKS